MVGVGRAIRAVGVTLMIHYHTVNNINKNGSARIWFPFYKSVIPSPMVLMSSGSLTKNCSKSNWNLYYSKFNANPNSEVEVQLELQLEL